MPDFSRIAIVNRGEAAVRLIRAVREVAHERGGGLCTIALHTEAERHALFVREADEAVLIGGPAPYLDHAVLERALRAGGADAAWVGWGFVAEDPVFADLCERIGVVFIGPPGDVMRRLGDKIGAKRFAEEVGVPVAAWSRGPVDTLDEALVHARTIGYPLMLKATAGGGGRGIRVAAAEAELADAFERARAEALRSFGDATIFMERLVTGARHIEVQVIADHHGAVWAAGVRDCTVQRRNQKVLEESCSPVLSGEQEQELRAAAARLAAAAGYRNAGTVEFLYQPEERLFAFLEVNTRLQVEHPVTELVTGLDLVKLQLHVAAGGRLEGEPPAVSGHAIEARLNAEDPERGFAPAPGTIALLRLPSGPGVRVDAGVAEGDVIAPEFDSMIAKVIGWGRNREEARARLHRALLETTVIVRGGTTNRAFLLDILDRPEVVGSTADTGWLDRLVAAEGHLLDRHADIALLSAAIDIHDAEEALERGVFFAAAGRGRPQARHEIGRSIELRHRRQGYRITVAQVGPQRYRLEVDGAAVQVESESLRPFHRRLTIDGHVYRVDSAIDGPEHLVEVEGVAHRVSRDDGGIVRAPAPALVVAISVAPGDHVDAGTPVAVLEAMKMEMTIQATHTGLVRDVLVAGNAHVEAGAPLVRIEPHDDSETATAAATTRVTFGVAQAGGPAGDPAGPDVRGVVHEHLAAARSLIMGYDVTLVEARRLVAAFERTRDALPADDPDLLHAELETLEIFAELAELSRNWPAAEADELGDGDGDATRSPREHFRTYLRSLDAERERLPETFRARLARALARYGVHGTERTPELEEAVYRIFLAHKRTTPQLPAVRALLDRRLQQADALPEGLRDEFRATLDRLIVAAQVRHPAIGELARSVRFRLFDQPLIQQGHQHVLSEARRRLAHLDAHPDAPDRAAHVEALVQSPHPLISLLSGRNGVGHAPDPLLEILARRYYRVHPLDDVRPCTEQGRPFVTGRYAYEGRDVHLITTMAQASELAGAAEGAARLAAASGAGDCVVDFYVAWGDPPRDLDAMGGELAGAIALARMPETVRRVAVSVSARGGAEVHHFTFHPSSDGVSEERVLRGLHPMIARRLQLWRLSNFDVRRVPTVDEIHVLQCVARDNPRDERLVALAEIRNITPVRDAAGRLTALPEPERVLGACLDGIRRVQAQRPQNRRLAANRVFLYIWPAIDVPLDELLEVTRSLAPRTAGLGLEAVSIEAVIPSGVDGELRRMALTFSYQPGTGVTLSVSEPPTEPMLSVDAYTQKVLQAQRRGTVYPYEAVPLLTRAGGTFTEHDLDADGRLVPVRRAPGGNTAGIVVGLVRTITDRHPEGMVRVAVLGDSTKALGAIAEPEAKRILGAIDLAAELQVPVEWLAVSAGAKISMESGTENMDWVSRVLRRLITFTQAGGEVNLIVAGINVGAQPYWNAEATMLQHTRGILIMTPEGAMVLTGKQALDFSGGVSAEDNFGIGGYDRIMGPNGQAQYWAPDLAAAVDVLFAHYDHAYVPSGERFPRSAPTTDPRERDICDSPHRTVDGGFRTVGEIFSPETNPDRKKPFDIRTVMRAVADQDHSPLERWATMAAAQTAVVLDAHLGGHPVTMIGIESRALARGGFPPADGPDQWTAGTLFPRSSKKVARAINAASGNRPVVVLANLSGFDGSPESLRELQLEYGAEIGRAVVNFDGPIVFCVISRYHGGAFVVFSGTLNDEMTVLAVEGSYASVIGGAPAAAAVFAAEIGRRTDADPRVVDAQTRLDRSEPEEGARLRAELAEIRSAVRSEKLGEVADEFDGVHSIQRAQQVGSIDEIVPAARLRPRIIEAVEAGMLRAQRRCEA
ncbi:ATP-grasp domain-containing protein [Baekduia soli]|uniref:biotin carboxylase n=1 Tax=Baekduia soli TaxID=496014 RepID=A0A5B8U050_9ACTN|nr:carboxyl transferase domain-containing protein [Baekduia soli]QEC46335.1 ATP-grasp domain-containing protein [Baekduia soli]